MLTPGGQCYEVPFYSTICSVPSAYKYLAVRSCTDSVMKKNPSVCRDKAIEMVMPDSYEKILRCLWNHYTLTYSDWCPHLGCCSHAISAIVYTPAIFRRACGQELCSCDWECKCKTSHPTKNKAKRKLKKKTLVKWVGGQKLSCMTEHMWR